MHPCCPLVGSRNTKNAQHTQQGGIMINWYIDRLSVSATNAEIVRDLCGRFRFGRTPDGEQLVPRPQMTRERRKALYRAALERHASNRALYRHATRQQ